MTTLATLLETATARYPSREAVVGGGTRLTYASLAAEANRVANLLVARGVGPGDKVALSCPNIPAFPIAYFGILKTGAIVVPLNVLLKQREVAYHLNDSDAKAYICFEGTADLSTGLEGHAGFLQASRCETFFLIPSDPQGLTPTSGEKFDEALDGLPTTFQTVARAADDTAVILYTSGTTGQPKGAELTHHNLVSNALASQHVFEVSATAPDTYLCVLPLFHSFGQTVIMNAAFAHGGTIILLPRFEAEATLQAMQEERVTFFAGVPTMYWSLLGALAEEETVDVARISRNLRVATSGGAALPIEVHREFEDRFGISILEGYGLSETSPVATYMPYGRAVRPGSVGLPIKGVEVKLIDPEPGSWTDSAGVIGEIAIKGPNVMKGYYNHPRATSEAIKDGWFRSGDIARRDEDGYYYIVDRSKDLIIRGGYNVYPREVEEVLMTHPEVNLVAVYGVPHASHGEEIKAAVIRTTGSNLTEAELVEWSKERMANYKYPRKVVFVQSLPMTATGKLLKRELS